MNKEVKLSKENCSITHNIPTILKLPNIIYINSFNTKSPPQKQEARQQRQNT